MIPTAESAEPDKADIGIPISDHDKAVLAWSKAPVAHLAAQLAGLAGWLEGSGVCQPTLLLPLKGVVTRLLFETSPPESDDDIEDAAA